jgi:hypothetical protein
MEAKTVRCRACNAEFTDAEIGSATSCPGCQSARRPVAIPEDVTLTLNWFELRILANYAERWAEVCDKEDPTTSASVQLILDRIRPLKPPGAAGLTLRDELGQLRDAGLDASMHDSTGAVVDKSPTKH